VGESVVRLCRAQIGRGTDGVDVTRKSAKALGRPFAPTWSMVLGYKRGSISGGQYRQQYLTLLEALDPKAIEDLWRQGVSDGGVLVLRCYCKDGTFCHTYLLLEWLITRYPTRFTI
jgi:uncharacterized protein YeaO (DUF488 family)